MGEETDYSCLNCIYKRPWTRCEPWTCPDCKLIHGVRLFAPEPSNDAIGWEAWALGEQIAQVHCVLRGQKRAKWRALLVDALVENMANSLPTTTASFGALVQSAWIEPFIAELSHEAQP